MPSKSFDNLENMKCPVGVDCQTCKYDSKCQAYLEDIMWEIEFKFSLSEMSVGELSN